ncbi:hypothetical protein BGW38_009461 [Lunasporangiospora selenospora]|uniref:Glycerophosphocholine acyltransferase 1 n=1 Tax=Lunasporangiospora selenospora TaxID=979761 RepID=A0A9P6KFW9_9FUNG|nr:hypothetical protein BGW38_009461 [Lunasporangiospora selenospora]
MDPQESLATILDDSDSDLTLSRSVSAPEPGELTYEDADASDSAILSEPASPILGPSLVPNILTQLTFSLDSFISQNLEEELSELPLIANQMYHSLRSDLSKTKKQLRHHVGTTKRRVQHKVDHTASNLKSQIDTSIMVWEKNMKKASVVRFMDKIAFTLGMFECCCTPWLVSQFPEWIPFVHTLQSVILIAVRYIIYKKKSFHFFLLDMCYYVNVAVILYLYVFPQSKALFGAIWLLSLGPLAFAIIAWRNSLVLHSLDKVTSVYIHMSPPITLYVVRWLYPDPDHIRFPAMKDMDVLPTAASLFYAIALYLTWQIAYYVLVVVRQREKIASGKRVTSYTWLLGDPKGGAIAKVAHSFGERYSIPTFMAMQLAYTFVTCLFALLVYRSFKLNTAFLVSLFLVSVWNGACYYMEVFSKQYEVQLSKLAEEVSSAVAANQLEHEQEQEKEKGLREKGAGVVRENGHLDEKESNGQGGQAQQAVDQPKSDSDKKNE